jgi:hypothetical protein
MSALLIHFCSKNPNKQFVAITIGECECEEVASVCTQDGELIVIEWKVQEDATI